MVNIYFLTIWVNKNVFPYNSIPSCSRGNEYE